MPRYKCYSCMKEFDSARSFPNVESRGRCPRCFTMVTDAVNQVSPPVRVRSRANSAPQLHTPVLARPRTPPLRIMLPPEPRPSMQCRALIGSWCRVQLKGVAEEASTQFEQKLIQAVAELGEAAEDTIKTACAITKVEKGHTGKTVLLFRFYDGKETGLLPPSKHSYDKVVQPTSSSMGSAQAHQEGLKSGSNYLSMSGNLPGLVSTSCANVRGIVYGLSKVHQALLAKKVPIHGLQDRRAPALGVFLVPPKLWKIDHDMKSERVHLSMHENEVLFDASQGRALKDFHLFSVPNPFRET